MRDGPHAFLRQGSLGEGFTIMEDSRASVQVASMTDKAAIVCYPYFVPPRILIEIQGRDKARAPSSGSSGYSDPPSLPREAAIGCGDRHLLRLRLVMRPKASEKAALSDDPLFDRSHKWELSTSALRDGGRGGLFRGTRCVACLSEASQKRKLGFSI